MATSFPLKMYWKSLFHFTGTTFESLNFPTGFHLYLYIKNLVPPWLDVEMHRIAIVDQSATYHLGIEFRDLWSECSIPSRCWVQGFMFLLTLYNVWFNCWNIYLLSDMMLYFVYFKFLFLALIFSLKKRKKIKIPLNIFQMVLWLNILIGTLGCILWNNSNMFFRKLQWKKI